MAVSGQKWGVALKDLSKERISSARSNMVEGKVEAVNFNPSESAIGGRVEGNQHGTRNVQ